MAIITIDGTEVQIPDDERLNLIQTADRAGISIPYYCWHPGLSVVASCASSSTIRILNTPRLPTSPRKNPAC